MVHRCCEGLRGHCELLGFTEADIFLQHLVSKLFFLTWLGNVLERGRRQGSSYPCLIIWGEGETAWKQISCFSPHHTSGDKKLQKEKKFLGENSCNIWKTFLDTQVFLAPTPVRRSVGLSYFRISIPSSSSTALRWPTWWMTWWLTRWPTWWLTKKIVLG